MPKISFVKNNKTIEISSGANLMKSLLDNEIPVASSCHSDGVCGKCRMNIVQGMKNLSSPNETEILLQEKYQLSSDQRISCQTEVYGDIQIDTGYW